MNLKPQQRGPHQILTAGGQHGEKGGILWVPSQLDKDAFASESSDSQPHLDRISKPREDIPLRVGSSEDLMQICPGSSGN